jgi:WD40 repeat protein
MPALRLEPPEEAFSSLDTAHTIVLHNDRTLNVPPSFGERNTVAFPVFDEPVAEDHVTVTLPVEADSELETPPLAPVPAEPLTVPGYEILNILGRGGMGVVYLARAATTGRLVALKTILGGFGVTDADRQQFLREARAVAHLQHPNIVRVLEVGEVRGQPFFCLEYIGGGTLADHLRGVPLPPRDAARLVQTLAQAMQTAHASGIIHRDLKPGNILLEGRGHKDDRAGDGEGVSELIPRVAPLQQVPKITDFGLAKHVESEGERPSSGWIIGTPSYMAPEQAEGKNQAVGPAADVYALGAILYECLTGRPPFQGTTALETLNLVQKGELVRPRSLNPSVPVALETICLMCLRKAPQERYSSAQALADDLGRFLHGQPIRARRPTLAEECQRWIARNATLFLLLTTIGFGLLLLAGTSLWHSWTLQAALNKTETANETARLEKDRRLRKQLELEDRDALLRLYLYAATIQQAQHLWNQGDVRSMRDILQPYAAGKPDAHRDFAIRYLDQLLRGDVATLSGHQGDVYAVAWSPDGSTLASAGRDHDLRLWDTATGGVRRFPAHTSDINAVAFSPDGRIVATGSDDGRIGLWDATTGELESYLPAQDFTPAGQPVGVVSVAFAGDSLGLYAGVGNGNVYSWPLDPDAHPSKLTNLGARIECLSRSADGRWLAIASGSSASVFDLVGHTRRDYAVKPGKAQSVAFSPSARLLAVGCTEGTVKVFDRQKNQQTLTLSGHIDQVCGLDFTPDGELLISGGQEGGIGLWATSTGHDRGRLAGHSGRIWCVAVSPDGTQVASASGDGTVKLWPVPTEFPAPGAAPERPATSTHIDPKTPCHALTVLSGVPLALLGTDCGVRFLPLAGNPEQTHREVRTDEEVHTQAISPDRRHLLVSQGPGNVVLYDLVSGTHRRLLQSWRGEIPVAFSGDGHFAAVGVADGEVHIFKMPSGDPVPANIKVDGSITSLAFQPGSQRIAIGSMGGWVTLWEREGSKALATWHAHQSDVFRIAFNDKGTLLATAGRDRTARLWDATTHQEVHHGLLGNRLAVIDVAFCPDGQTVATASQGGEVHLWNLATGRELLSFDQPGPVTGIGFLDADHLLIAGNTNDKQGYLRLYTAAPE